MTREEALSMIIDALDDVEQFDEALNVLRTDAGAEEATTWKAKYNDLSEKYKTRFKDEVMSQPSEAFKKPEETTVVPEKVAKLEDLDFSGETE